MSVRLRVQRVRENAVVPSYKSTGAAGLDLSACVEGEGVTLEPGCVEFIPIGIAIAIEPGYEGQVRPRSGLASKHLVTLPNTPGTIDSDYRGEVFVPLINLGREPFVITPGMRVAQLVIAPVVQAEIEEASSLDPTDRGEGGFGSTGL